MTRRYTSGFDILGFDTDPTPGDPDLITSQIVPAYQSIGDDAEAALNALNSNAVESGAGQTMQALQNLIGTSYPPKLQTAADSYHSAASIYSAYAQALTEAQNQLDQAMDQAAPVAAMASTTVRPAPPNASADQVAAVQQQQQSVDQANDQLTAAKRLAQDAQDMRNQAGNTFNSNLNDVSSIPDESFWQKLLDFFEHNPVFQIFVDIAIAVVSIFFPVVGLVLGAVDFGLTTALNTIATGHLDIGNFVTGLLGLALGVGIASGAFKALGTVAGGLFKTVSGAAGKGIVNDASLLGKVQQFAGTTVGKVGLSTVGNFAYSAGTNAASNAIDGQPIDAAQVLGSAAVGAAVGGAFAGVGSHFGLEGDPVGGHTPNSAQAPHAPGPATAPPAAGSPPPAGPAVQAPPHAPAGAAPQSPAGSPPAGAAAATQAPAHAPNPTAAQSPAGSPPAGAAAATQAPPHAPNPAAAQSPAGSPPPAAAQSPAGSPPPAGPAVPAPAHAAAPATAQSPAGSPPPAGPAVPAPAHAAAPATAPPPAGPAAQPPAAAQPANNPAANAFGQAGQVAQNVASAGTQIGINNAEGNDSQTTGDQEVQAAQQAEVPLAVGKYNPPFT